MRVEALTILAASAAVVMMVAALAPRAIHAQASSPVRGLTVRELRSPSAFASIADPPRGRQLSSPKRQSAPAPALPQLSS